MIIHESQIIAAAFIIAVVILGKPVTKIVKQMLYKYSDVINSSISSAVSLKEKAKSILSHFSFNKGQVEAEDKIKLAKKTAQHTIDSALEEIEKMMQEKLDYAIYKMAQHTAIVMQELRETSAYIAADAVRKYIEENSNDNVTQKEMLSIMSADFRKKLH